MLNICMYPVAPFQIICVTEMNKFPSIKSYTNNCIYYLTWTYYELHVINIQYILYTDLHKSYS